jgi:hypothetical protein
VLQVVAHGGGDVREVAHALGRHDGMVARGGLALHLRQLARSERETFGDQPRGDGVVEGRDAVVVEARGLGAEHGHLVGLLREHLAVALVLLAHIAQRVLRALAVVLVDRHEVGEVQHVDLLELARGAEFRRHHVERGVHERHDGRVALADARGLHQHEVEAREPAGRDHLGQRRRDLLAGIARGERAHVDVRVVDRVHADAVAQQRAAGALARGIDGDDGDAQLVRLVEPQAQHQLVGERALAGPARPGDAERGRPDRLGGLEQALARAVGVLAVLQRGDDAGEHAPVAALERVEHLVLLRRGDGNVVVGTLEHVVDHALQAQRRAVLGGVDARDAVVVQLADLPRDDHAAATAEDLDVRAAVGAQQVEHVLEVLDVAALVRRDRDGLHVLLQRRAHDLAHGAVVTEVDHLGARGLEDAPHDVDRGVVAVEERGGGDEAHLVGELVGREVLADREVVHGAFLQSLRW